jgi:translation initiation factor 4E
MTEMQQESSLQLAVEASAAASPTVGASAHNTESSKPPSSDLALHGKWTLWYDNPKVAPAGSEWKESLVRCGNFESVGTFWAIFNNLKPATQISVASNYSVFRYGIEPSWEDEANCDGGKFVLTIPKKESRNGKCDEFLAVIGETLDATGDQVNGAVVSIRKSNDRIALWLKSSDRDLCVQIGERWKMALNLDKLTIRYQTHKDAAASGRSFRNDSQFEV